MPNLIINPVLSLSGIVSLPGSKSISNRSLLLAALANGTTEIINLLDSEDTTLMLNALIELGIRVEKIDDDRLILEGASGPLPTKQKQYMLDLGLAGTALRPLTAALTLGKGRFVIDGNSRMRERPISDLVQGLQELGAKIKFLRDKGYPPIEVLGTGLDGGDISLPGNISSQYLTSILMIAPLTNEGVSIEVTGTQVSKPYLDITIEMMREFGVKVSHSDYKYFHVDPQEYQSPGEFFVEGDASSATYFLAAGAISGDGITVRGLDQHSIQGDLEFAQVLKAMGGIVEFRKDEIFVSPGDLKAIDMDLNHIPDAAMTVAILALFATGTTTIRNIQNWRVKETDRLYAMSQELRKVGAIVEEGEDYLTITPPEKLKPAVIETYGDHRMAMCFSLIALGGITITIIDPNCVTKTFPGYFEEFDRLTHR